MVPLAVALLLLVPPPPADDVHVVDTTGRLTPAGVAAAEAAADEWAERTTNDVVVAVVPDLEGRSVEAYTAELFASWQPGLPGVDNGVVVVVAVDDRELRVEAGLDLADELTLERAGEVASAALPALRDDDLDAAVLGLITDVIDVVDRAQAGLPPRTTPTVDERSSFADDDADDAGTDFPWWVVVIPGGWFVYYVVQRLRGQTFDWSAGGDGTSGRRRFGGSSWSNRSSGSRRSSSGSSRRSSSRSSRGGRSSGRGASRKW